MNVSLSPMFMCTFIGLISAVSGITLMVLYSRRWTRVLCLMSVLVGGTLLLSNPATSIWDVLVAVGASVVAALAVLLALTIAWQFGLIEPKEK